MVELIGLGSGLGGQVVRVVRWSQNGYTLSFPFLSVGNYFLRVATKYNLATTRLVT